MIKNSKCKSLSQRLIRLWRKNSIRQLADKLKVKIFCSTFEFLLALLTFEF